MDKLTIPCCYHPTTIVLVDDNYKYLSSLRLGLNSQLAAFKLFNDPAKALHFLNEEYEFNPFINRCLQEDVSHDRHILDVNVRAIRNEVYNSKRFTEVGCVIADYVMPGIINGLDLCHQIKDKLTRRILLTGEAPEQKVLQGFNDSNIHQYIRKDENNFSQKINSIIARELWQYFLDLSSLITSNITENSQLKILNDPNFIQLFNEIRQKTNNVEFYLLDKQGSFLLFDRAAKPSWLIVKNDREIEKLYQYAKDEEAPTEVVNALKERKMIPYFHDDKDMQTPPSRWKNYLYPANLLNGNQSYYYAFITDNDAFKLNKDRILSYEGYLESI